MKWKYLIAMIILIQPVYGLNHEFVAGQATSTLWVTHATEKIFQDQSGTMSTTPGTDQSVSLSVAKGGNDAFQVVVSPSSDANDIVASVGSFTSGSSSLPTDSITLYLEYYVNVREETLFESVNDYSLGLYPDALIPLTKAFSVKASKNQPIWVQVDIPDSIPAGEYTGTIDFTGGISGSIQVSINVLDFEVPKDSQLYNPGYADLWQLQSYTDTLDEWHALVKKYVEFFAQRGIILSDTIDALDTLPTFENGKWQFDEWKADMDPLFQIYRDYFNQPVVRVPVNFADTLKFEVVDAAQDDSMEKYSDFLRQFKEYVMGTDLKDFHWLVWIDDLDEPSSDEIAWLIAKYALLTKDASDTDLMFHYRIDGSIDWDSPVVQYDLEADTSKWEPLDDKFTAWAALQEDIEWDKGFLQPAIDRGAKVTIYQQAWTAIELPQDEEELSPDVEQRNYEFPSLPGIVNPALFSRILPWIVLKYNLAGVNFWAVMAWYNSKTGEILDMYEASPALKIRGDTVAQNGDGFLVYPGNLVSEHASQDDVDGPVSSIRLELFRLGIEDYKYLKLLDESLDSLTSDKDEAEGLLNEALNLVKSVTQFDADSKKYDEVLGKIKTFLANHKGDIVQSLAKLNWDFAWNPSPLTNEAPPEEGFVSMVYWAPLTAIATIVYVRKSKRKKLK